MILGSDYLAIVLPRNIPQRQLCFRINEYNTNIRKLLGANQFNQSGLWRILHPTGS